jgi:tetratricopeptide (TPR) repeat protein
VVDLSWSLHNYSHGRESRHRWDEVFDLGARAARELGDRAAEVDLRTQFGSALHWAHQEHDRALPELRAAAALAQEIDYHRGIAIANSSIGLALLGFGRAEEALRHNTLAHRMSLDYDFFETRFWMALAFGLVLQLTGQPERALEVHGPLVAEAESRRDQTNRETWLKVRILALTHVGDDLAALERWEEAAHHYHEAGSLVSPRHPGYRSKAELVLREGIAWRKAGKHHHARTRLSLAVELLDGTADREDRERAEAELVLLPE